MIIKPLVEGPDGRLKSLDVFRGIVMFLLIGEATGLYGLLLEPALKGTIIHAIGVQFQHHPWNGLRLWDLGQPFFMFISGTAMVFSYEKRRGRGESWGGAFGHTLRRSFLLLLFGWALYRISPVDYGPWSAFFSDILPQLAVAGLVSFLLLRRSALTQIGFSVGLIVLTDLLYRLWGVPGFDQPFTPGHNFGSYIDVLLFGQVSLDHWVAFNIVPSASFMLGGVLAGKLLMSPRLPAQKIRLLLISGLLGVTVGLALSPVTPVIRRISTSTFIVLSVGFCYLALALAFGIIDVMRFRTWALFSVPVGMNSLFIYLFAQSGGGDWLGRVVEPFMMGFARWTGEWPAQVATSLATWGLLWAICYWLYRRRIFIKV